MFHDKKNFRSNFLKSLHLFQVQRMPNGFPDTLERHFSEMQEKTGKQRRKSRKLLEGACAVITLCLAVDNLSNVSNLAVEYKY